MTFRSRYLLASALGLWLVYPSMGQEPSRHGRDATALGDNQQTANAIAARLRKSGPLRQCAIQVVYQNGVAELSGQVSSQAQSDEAVQQAASVAGVQSVVNRITIGESKESKVVRADARVMSPAAGPAEPAPIMQGPPPSPYDLNPPKMPPYAWPSYAPYNNYSRVAYPTAYPYEAFPFVGPVYPFPKVPLGWRKVKLEWDDGHWWLSNVSSQHDYWRLRYW